MGQPDDLRYHTLLHVEWKEAEASWRMWLLAAGLRPFDPSFSTPLKFSYYLLSAKDSPEQPKVATFRDWLLEEARTSRP